MTLGISGPSKKNYTLEGVRTMKNLQLPTQSLDFEDLQKKFAYLKGLPIDSYQKAKPTILIGVEHSHLLIPFERRSGKPNEPIAIKSKLGWFIFGNISASIQNHFSMIHQEEEMTNMMKAYFSTEDFGVKISKNPLKSEADKRVETIMDQTLKYTNGRYEVGLLWKSDNTIFPESYLTAKKNVSR